jgi:hypothetical protein
MEEYPSEVILKEDPQNSELLALSTGKLTGNDIFDPTPSDEI